MLKSLNLKQLLALQALFQTRCISTAAHRCNMTQPAMSSNLKKFRECFSDPLLVPTGKKLELTHFAEKLWPKLNEALLAVANLTAKTSFFEPLTESRHFIIGVPDFYEYIILDELFKYTQKTNPKITFEIKYQEAIESVEQINTNKIDMALTLMRNEQVLPEGTSFLVIHEDPLYYCIKKVNNKNAAPLTLNQYIKADHIILSNKHAVPGGAVNSSLLKLNKTRNIIGIYSSIMAAMHAQQKNDNIIISGPRTIFEFTKQYFQIQSFPLPLYTGSWQLILVWHNRFDHDAGIKWLSQFIKNILLTKVNPKSVKQKKLATPV